MSDDSGTADAKAALQYLIWALEHIKSTGNQDAADHSQLALEALRKDVATESDQTDDASRT